MAEHKVIASDQQIEAALNRAKLHKGEPVATSVEHVEQLNLLLILLSNGRRLVMPLEEVQGLEGATHEQITHYELLGRGTGISFPELDVDLYVPALIDRIYGNRQWMTRLGTTGSGATTEVKRSAARAKSGKSGRSRNPLRERA